LFSLVFAFTACDGCSEKKPEQKDQGTVVKEEKDMAPAKEPDLPKEDPLKEAKEKAEKDGTDVGVGRMDIANLAAANIEAALKEGDSKPKTRIRSTSRETGSIDSKDAAKVFRKFEGAMKMCYERALKKSPGIEGKVNLSVVVSEDGSVSRADARGVSLKSSQVSNCMEQLAKRMKFPKPKGGAARLNKPYVFKPAL
jgi:hypothetical protein